MPSTVSRSSGWRWRALWTWIPGRERLPSPGTVTVTVLAPPPRRRLWRIAASRWLKTASGQHGRHPPPAKCQLPPPDGVYAAVDDVEAAGLEAALYLSGAVSKGDQLPTR